MRKWLSYVVPYRTRTNMNKAYMYKLISSVESQKGVIADQRCSVENKKGAIAINFVQPRSDSALLVLNGTSLNCNNVLLALNWRFAN